MAVNAKVFEAKLSAFEHKYLTGPGSAVEFEKMKKQQDFIRRFPQGGISKLSMDDYVEGKGSRDSFCYWLEFGTSDIARIGGRPGTHKFGVWYEKKSGMYSYAKKYGTSTKSAFDEIKHRIVDLINKGSTHDLNGIEKIDIPELLKGKILSLYFPDKYLGACAESDVNQFLRELGISYSPRMGLFERKELIVDEFWKNPVVKRNKLPPWSLYILGEFLYYAFLPKKSEAAKVMRLSEIEQQKGVSLSQIGLDTITDKESLNDARDFLRDYKAKVGKKVRFSGNANSRDMLVISKLKKFRGFRCQICGGNVKRESEPPYVEAAHIIPKSKKGNEDPSNILILCPNHHKEFDLGRRETLDKTDTSYRFRLNGNEFSVDLTIA